MGEDEESECAQTHGIRKKERKTKENAMTEGREKAAKRRRLKRRARDRTSSSFAEEARREPRNADSTNRSVCPLEVCADGEVARGMGG